MAAEEQAPAPPGGESMFVAVRLRPLNEVEQFRNRDACVWRADQDGQTLRYGAPPGRTAPPVPVGASTTFTFDRVFGQDASSAAVYDAVAAPLVRAAVGGINGTLFAYGQTGGGKTHTMKAVMEAASSHVFELIEHASPGRQFLLRLSAVEIYNEVVRDLLAEDTPAVRLLDDPTKGTCVDGAREEAVRSPRHVRHLLSLLEPRRQVGDNGINTASSRSHLVVRLTIESRPPDISLSQADGAAPTDHGPEVGALVASLYFVDLAGSERTSKTGAEGVRLKEGCHINRSLLTLGTVIRKLAAGGTGSHVPYRDSKLTRILAHALGGNGRSAVVCCISPASSAVEATRASLLFADSARRVTNYARVNETVDDKVLLRQYQAEISRLRAQLERATQDAARARAVARHRSGAAADLDNDGFDDGDASTAALEEALAARAALEKRLRGLELFILSAGPSSNTYANTRQYTPHRQGRTMERSLMSGGDDLLFMPRPRSWSPPATPRQHDGAATMMAVLASPAGAATPGARRSTAKRTAAKGVATPGGEQAGSMSSRRVLRFDTGDDDDDSETDGSDLQMNLAPKPVMGPDAAVPQPGDLADDIHALEGAGGARGDEAGRALAAEMRVLRIHTVVGNLTSSLEEDEIMARLQRELEERLAVERGGSAASNSGADSSSAAPAAEQMQGQMSNNDMVAALTAEVARLQARVDAARAADLALEALNQRLAASQADLDRYAEALAEANARAEAAARAAATSPPPPPYIAHATQQMQHERGGCEERGLRESDENLAPAAICAAHGNQFATSPARSPMDDRAANARTSPSTGAVAGGEWAGPRLLGGLIDTWKNRETPPPMSPPPGKKGTSTSGGGSVAAAEAPGNAGSQTPPVVAATGAWVPRSALDGERERRVADMRRLQECVAGAAAEGAALKGHLLNLRDELQRAEFQKKRLIAQVLKLEHAVEAGSTQCNALSAAAANERRRRRREQAKRVEAQEEARHALARCEAVSAAAAAAGALGGGDATAGGVTALAGHLLDSWAGPPTAAWYLPKILRLWSLLNIPLLHRSQFYLGFRGRETFYWDAEHRRLAWLQSSFKAAKHDAKLLARHPLAGAADALARERADLARRLRSLPDEERIRLYGDFGIEPHSKARKKALATKLWVDANDVTLRGASAELVLRLHGQDPGQDLGVVFHPTFLGSR